MVEALSRKVSDSIAEPQALDDQGNSMDPTVVQAGCLVDFIFKESCSALATSNVERPLQSQSQPNTVNAETSTSAKLAEVSQ